MLPSADFNFFVCGFATFAATVGYAYSRRLSSSSPSILPQSTLSSHQHADEYDDESIITPPASPGSEVTVPATPSSDTSEIAEVLTDDTNAMELPSSASSGPTAPASGLKRKREEDDENSHLGYPFNLDSIYPPCKRSRTPPTEPHEHTTAINEIPTISPAQTSDIIEEIPLDKPFEQQPPHSSISAAESPKPVAEENQVLSHPAFASPNTSFGLDIALTRTPSPRPIPPSSGFAAFAGKSSPFGSPRLQPTTTGDANKPVWCSLGSPKWKAIGGAVSGHITSVNEEPALSKAAAIAPAPVPTETPHAYVSGEEDEEVETELKHVKLYTKRGKRAFSEGLLGHVKLLSHKTTSERRLGASLLSCCFL
ncbi:hypothetical protein HGRIS_005281 [Hohenbuehelia grisea]|uniref:Uncharacterized protein n=1 Tax=Hohenbuehelia grisea TaxID=104357 RepID=A0ABR3JF21_9AGAR